MNLHVLTGQMFWHCLERSFRSRKRNSLANFHPDDKRIMIEGSVSDNPPLNEKWGDDLLQEAEHLTAGTNTRD